MPKVIISKGFENITGKVENAGHGRYFHSPTTMNVFQHSIDKIYQLSRRFYSVACYIPGPISAFGSVQAMRPEVGKQRSVGLEEHCAKGEKLVKGMPNKDSYYAQRPYLSIITTYII